MLTRDTALDYTHQVKPDSARRILLQHGKSLHIDIKDGTLLFKYVDDISTEKDIASVLQSPESSNFTRQRHLNINQLSIILQILLTLVCIDSVLTLV